MLKPSYAELMDVLNENGEGKNINSRYTIVIAAAKRARQLIDGDEPMVEGYNEGKPVSTAVQELYENKIQIVGEGQGTVLNLNKNPELDVKADLEKVKAENESEADEDSEAAEFDEEMQDMLEDSEELDELIDFDEEDEEE